jgi:uncharacterized protein (TIGR02246 family)
MMFMLASFMALSHLILGASPFQATPTAFPMAQVNPETSHPRESELMKPEEIRLLIKQAGDAWVRGDAGAFAALFAPDGEFIVPGNRWVGKAEIEKAAANFLVNHSDVKILIRRLIIEGNQAAVEWHWEDREKATGRRSQADDAIVIDWQNGQIVRWREYIDTLVKNHE